ncbi:hypothetical protein BDR04DRAFT_823541 [Suillus decipiens]|nr:hypothetical protein BDR04DRAFT_823541 [Suillus decipiens]
MIFNFNWAFLIQQATDLDAKCFEGRELATITSIVELYALQSCCPSRCHLYHITMLISTTSRRSYRISITHHNQPRQRFLHHHPPRPSYLIRRFCPIELRARQPRAISKLVHGLCAVYLHITYQHNHRTTKNVLADLSSHIQMLSLNLWQSFLAVR